MAQLRPVDFRILNEVPEHMAQECFPSLARRRWSERSSMKFLSTWLRNLPRSSRLIVFTRLSSMKFLSTWLRNLWTLGRPEGL